MSDDTNNGTPGESSAPFGHCEACGTERDTPTRLWCRHCRLARRPNAPTHRRLHPRGRSRGLERHLRIFIPHTPGSWPTYARLTRGYEGPCVVSVSAPTSSDGKKIPGVYYLVANGGLVLADETPEATRFTSYTYAQQAAREIENIEWYKDDDGTAHLVGELMRFCEPNAIAHELAINDALRGRILEAMHKAKAEEAAAEQPKESTP